MKRFNLRFSSFLCVVWWFLCWCVRVAFEPRKVINYKMSWLRMRILIPGRRHKAFDKFDYRSRCFILRLRSSTNIFFLTIPFRMILLVPRKARRNLKIYFSIWLFGLSSSSRRGFFAARPQNDATRSISLSSNIRNWYKFHWIKIENKGEKVEEEKYLKSKLFALVEPGLGKYSIKIFFLVEMNFFSGNFLVLVTEFPFAFDARWGQNLINARIMMPNELRGDA